MSSTSLIIDAISGSRRGGVLPNNFGRYSKGRDRQKGQGVLLVRPCSMAENIGKYTVAIGEGKPRLASKNAISPIYRYDVLQQIDAMAGLDRQNSLGNPGHHDVLCAIEAIQYSAALALDKLWDLQERGSKGWLPDYGGGEHTVRGL